MPTDTDLTDRTRIYVSHPRGTTDFIQGIGKRHNLKAEEAYGAALAFAEENQADFESFIQEHVQDD